MAEASGSAFDGAQQAILGEGTQNVYYGMAQAAEPPVSIVPPAPPQFPLRARDDLITALIAGWGRVHVVHGLGGCGKTHIASELIRRVEDEAEVWWLSALTRDLLQGGLRSLGRKLGMTGDDLRGSGFADRLWELLKNHERRWLLVIDNVDDASMLSIDGKYALARGRGWLRPVRTDNGAVLVTSRDGEEETWGTWCALHRVGVVSPDEGASILRDRAPRAGDQAAARALADALGGLPLALDLAGNYLAQTARHGRLGAREVIKTFDEFRAALESGRAELVFPDGDSDLAHRPANAPLGATWNLSLQHLEAQGMPAARPLLSLLAQFAAAPIPYEELLAQEALYGEDAFTEDGVWKALSGLARLSLVDLISPEESEFPLLTLHPLIRNLGRSQASASYPALAWSLLASSVRSAAEPGDLASCRYWDEMKPQIDAWLAAAMTTEAAEAAGRVAEHLLATDQAIAAEESARSYLAALGSSSTASPGSVLSMRYFLAQALSAQRRYDEALIEFTEILAGQRRILGAEHPATLRTRVRIASILRARARYAQAEGELRDILAVQSRVLDPGHADIMETRQGLTAAIAYQGGRFAEAEAEYRAILSACQSARPSHHLTLRVRESLAGALMQQGRYVAAEEEYRGALAARVRLLGADHPSALAARNQLALAIFRQGRYADAEEELRELLAVAGPLLGAEHPYTLSSRDSLAFAILWQGRYEEAEAGLAGVLAVRMRTLGADHPDTLASRNDLSVAHFKQGRYVDAEADLRAVIAAATRVLGAGHPYCLTARNNLAVAIGGQGRRAEAEGEFRAVIAAETQVLGEDHPSVLRSRYGLAAVLAAQGRKSEALTEFRDVHERRARVLGSDHPDTKLAARFL